MDAFPAMDLVSSRAMRCLAHVHGELLRGGDAHVSGQGGVLPRGHVPQRAEPQPVGGRDEHLHAGVRV